MIFCFANSSTYMGLLFILIFLLYRIGCDKIEDGILPEEERYLRQFRKSCI